MELAKIELLKEQLKTAIEDTNKVKLLQSISFQYKYIDPELGLKYGKQSLSLANKLGSEKQLPEIYNSIGGNFYALGKFNKSLDYFDKALKLNQKNSQKEKIANNYGNIGNVYYNLSDFTTALKNYFIALKINEEIKNEVGIASDYGSIGDIYSVLKENKIALSYYNKALTIYNKIDDRRGVATTLGNMGTTYNELKEYKKARYNFNKALELWTLFGNKFGIAVNLGNLANSYYSGSEYMKSLDYYQKALDAYKELGNQYGIASIMGNLGNLYLMMSKDSIIEKINEYYGKINIDKRANIHKAIEYSENAINLAGEVGTKDMLINWYMTLDNAYGQLGNFKKAYIYQEKWTTLRDSIFSSEKTKEIAELEANKQKEINLTTLKLKDLELERKNNEQILLFAGIGGIIIILIIIAYQRKKSETLLLNILPSKIAQRLKRNEKNIADRFENTAIIFIDIVGFTTYTEGTDPVKVVTSLNDIFTKFDILAKEFGLEKIKTIGDCYMAVAGLPEPHPQPVNAVALFAIKAKEIMQNYETNDGYHLQFRIGIDAGPVVAGVIGSQKFSYDLWGDTVNTASRMESTGLPNEIQITETFASQLTNKDLLCQERGEIEVKGKGKVKTFLLKKTKLQQRDIIA